MGYSDKEIKKKKKNQYNFSQGMATGNYMLSCIVSELLFTVILTRANIAFVPVCYTRQMWWKLLLKRFSRVFVIFAFIRTMETWDEDNWSPCNKRFWPCFHRNLIRLNLERNELINVDEWEKFAKNIYFYGYILFFFIWTW